MGCGASRLQLPNCPHHKEHTWSILYILVQFLRCFPRLGNHFLTITKTITKNNEPQTYSIPIRVPIRFVRVASSPQSFWHFLGDCPGQWRLMSGPLGSMFRESKWSEFARWNVQHIFFLKTWKMEDSIVFMYVTTGYSKNPLKHQGMVIIHVISCNYRMIRITTYHLNSDKCFRIRIRWWHLKLQCCSEF